MKLRIVLLALGAWVACNAQAAGSFSVYFNGESPTANCHVDNVSNAQLSTSGNGNLVVTTGSPFTLSSACGVSGNGQQLTFGPAQPLAGPVAPLAAGANVLGSFSILPLNAASCTVSYSGVNAPPGGNVCGLGATPSCSSSTPIPFTATFTNTGTNAVTYQATASCQAAAGASPTSLQSSVTFSQNGNSGGTPIANFTCTQTASLTVSCLDSSTETGGIIGSWSWNFGDGGTSNQQSPTHTYASAGTKTVTLTVADSVNPSNTNTLQKQVAVTTGGASACTTGQTGDLPGYTALCSGQLFFYGTNQNLPSSPWTFDYAFGVPWPGSRFGQTMKSTLSQTQFMSIPFTPSPGHTVGVSVNTTYMPNNNAMFSVSTAPGLFNNGVANGNTVLCAMGRNPSLTLTSNNYATAQCKLNPGVTYWLNMVPGVMNGGSFIGCNKSPCNVAFGLVSQIN